MTKQIEYLDDGCHDGISHFDYVNDPCEGGSLNSSGIHTMMMDCPLRFWEQSSLNPDKELEKPSIAVNMGTLIHDILLLDERLFTERYAVRPDEFNDYRKAVAKEWRDQALEQGYMIITSEQIETAKRAADAALNHHKFGKIFENTLREQTLIWTCKETGVRCRARLDLFSRENSYECDYKSTTTSANPKEFSKNIWNFGYYIQRAFYKEAFETVFGEELDKSYMLVQEQNNPNFISLVELDEFAMENGKMMVNLAKRKYAECLKNNYWPGYDTEIYRVELPGWAEAQLIDIKDRMQIK